MRIDADELYPVYFEAKPGQGVEVALTSEEEGRVRDIWKAWNEVQDMLHERYRASSTRR